MRKLIYAKPMMNSRKHNTSMTCTITELSLSNKNLENEKSSLLTALQLVQNDYNQSSIKSNTTERPWNIVNNHKPNQIQLKSTHNPTTYKPVEKPPINRNNVINCSSSNRYENHTYLSYKYKIKQVHHSSLLGVQIDEKLSWNKHVESVARKVTSGVGALKRIRDFADRETLISIYNALVRPHFDYCSEVWDTLGIGHSTRLQKLQNREARIVMGMTNDTPGLEAITALGWETLESRRAKSKAVQMYKVLNDLAPNALVNLFMPKRDVTDYELRGSSTSLQIPFPRTENIKKSFSYDGAKLWQFLT